MENYVYSKWSKKKCWKISLLSVKLYELFNFLFYFFFKKKVPNSRKTLQSTKTPSPNHPINIIIIINFFLYNTSIFSSSLMINGFIFEFMYIKMQCIFFNIFFVPSFAVVENYIFILMLQHIFDTKQKQQWHKKKIWKLFCWKCGNLFPERVEFFT